MTIRSYGIAIAMTLVMLGSPAYGQSPSCYDDMIVPGRCLPWGFTNLAPQLAPGGFLPTDFSRDGTTVTGHDEAGTVFRWNLETMGAQTLNLGGDQFVHGTFPVMSADGSVIAGTTILSGASSIFRWDAVAPDIMILPNGPANGIDIVFPGETDGTVVPYDFASISGDGNTITGIGAPFNGEDELLDPPVWVFRWTESGGTNDDPQLDFSKAFTPWTIAGNGTDIVGFLDDPGVSDQEAVTWSPNNGVSLGTGSMFSRATAVSYDGQVISGQRNDNGTNSRFFRWTQGTGAVDIPHRFQPRSVSDDGQLVTGVDLNSALPWTWTTTAGYRSLADYLGDFGISFPAPTTAPSPLAIVSGDGRIFAIVGEQWTMNAHPLNYVALGDSYSSGEGAIGFNESYRSGTDTAGPPENRCHRSNHAYAAVVNPPTGFRSYREIEETPALKTATGFTWDFIACSGALTYHVISNGGKRFPAEDPQLAQNLVDADTDLVTITIGGNDALFVLVLDRCAKNSPPLSSNCFDEIYPGTTETFGDLLDARLRGRVTDRVTEVYEEIKSQSMGNATIVALGYPLLLSDASGCPGAPGIIEVERNEIRRLGVLLNQQLAIAARRAGIHFVPEVATEFEEHNVCDSEPWIRGVNPLQRKVHWFHPTADGQRAYARVLQEFFGNRRLEYFRGFFESGMPRNRVPVP